MRILLSAAVGAAMVANLPAAVVSSGPQSILIPTNFRGIYLDFTDGNVNDPGVDPEAVKISISQPASWDFNLFYGGAGLWNSDTFQPVTDTAATNATVLGLQPDDAVSNASVFPTSPSGFSGSTGHVGTGAGQLPNGQKGYIGFRISPSSFDTNAPIAAVYGYMEVTLQDDNTPGVIHSWAWETDGSQIVVVPEPAINALAACSLAGLALLRRRREA